LVPQIILRPVIALGMCSYIMHTKLILEQLFTECSYCCVVTEQVADKPLKLVLKVGAPYTPSDVTSIDSPSETVDSDADKTGRPSKKKLQSEKVEHQEKKVLWSDFMCLCGIIYICGLLCWLY